MTATENANNIASQAYTITINSTPSITTSSLPAWTVNSAYSQTISVRGGTGPLTFAVSSGSLPAGLTLNASTGLISGKPRKAGSDTFTIQVTDAAKVVIIETYTLVIS